MTIEHSEAILYIIFKPSYKFVSIYILEYSISILFSFEEKSLIYHLIFRYVSSKTIILTFFKHPIIKSHFRIYLCFMSLKKLALVFKERLIYTGLFTFSINMSLIKLCFIITDLIFILLTKVFSFSMRSSILKLSIIIKLSSLKVTFAMK